VRKPPPTTIDLLLLLLFFLLSSLFDDLPLRTPKRARLTELPDILVATPKVLLDHLKKAVLLQCRTHVLGCRPD
jgi:hypothetical protein